MVSHFISFTTILLLFIASSQATVTERQQEDVAEDVVVNWKKNELLVDETPKNMEMLDNLRADVLNQGCGINLCFVMDGSDAVGQPEFLFQKNFIDLLMAITTTDNPGTYCAVQYHNRFSEISPLTNDRELLLERVHDAVKRTGGGNITPGLRYAINQLVKRKGAANKIVLFSRKKPFISKFLPPVLLRFFNIDGVVCSVAMKPENRLSLIHNVTGDPNLVFPRHSYFEISEVIFELVHELCGM